MQSTHRRLTDMAYRRRTAWGMASHCCWSRPRRAGGVAGGGWFSRTCLSRWSQKFSVGLRSGLQAGQSILTAPGSRLQGLHDEVGRCHPGRRLPGQSGVAWARSWGAESRLGTVDHLNCLAHGAGEFCDGQRTQPRPLWSRHQRLLLAARIRQGTALPPSSRLWCGRRGVPERTLTHR